MIHTVNGMYNNNRNDTQRTENDIHSNSLLFFAVIRGLFRALTDKMTHIKTHTYKKITSMDIYNVLYYC